MTVVSAISRHSNRIKGVSIVLSLLALLLLARALPLRELTSALEDWIAGLGLLAPFAFAGVYIVATVLLVPASLLTLVAGAIFGLWIGTAVVSVASTTGAALALLIGRYLAREKVRRMVEQSPRFAAVDRAVAEGGWKIVAMLRLSPAIPFNLQNYLYGLTSIGFWTCVLTSWVAMLPGTLMYVYLGHVFGLALGQDRQRTMGEWALLAVGLLTTIAVTRYITQLARRKLNEQSNIEPDKDQNMTPQQTTARKPTGAIVTALIAMAMLATAAYAQINPQAITGVLASLLGPAPVTLQEAHDPNPGGQTFDHAGFDAILKKHVDAEGWIDYAALKDDPSALDAYIASLAEAPFGDLSRDEKLALLINAYNAFTLRLILDHYPVKSIKDIPAAQRWTAVRWRFAGNSYSLDDIEHREIRPRFHEPRIHFALVCAAVGCPPLRNEAFTGARLEELLESQTKYVHERETWVRYDAGRNRLYLTPLYKWYGGDFEQTHGSVVNYVAAYVPAVKAALDARRSPRTSWLDYDWSLNSTQNRQPR